MPAARPTHRHTVRAFGRPAGQRGSGSPAGLFTVLVMGLALVLAGCADPGSAGSSGRSGRSVSSADDRAGSTSGTPSDTARDHLTGRTFLSTSIDGHDLVTGSTIRLTFDAARVTANAGCNTLSGTYRLADDAVTVHNMGGTEMGCEKALMDQDGWLAGWLTSGLHVIVDGDRLTLAGDDVTLRLADRRVLDPDRPLVGTTWHLDGIVSGSGPSASVSSVPQGVSATLRIADGQIHFFDGLNGYDGPVGPRGKLVVGPDTVRIHGDIAGSSAGCSSGGTCSVDMSLLTKNFHYRITASRLTVTGTGDVADRGLIFVARDGTAGSGSESPHPTAWPDPASGDASIPPAESAPVVTPGSLSRLTSEAPVRPSTPGRHDSIPPQPTPRSASQPDG